MGFHEGGYSGKIEYLFSGEAWYKECLSMCKESNELRMNECGWKFNGRLVRGDKTFFKDDLLEYRNTEIV